MARSVLLAGLIGLLVLVATATAQTAGEAESPCPRQAAGAVVFNPPELRSRSGVLETTLHFRSAREVSGLTRYCYVTNLGLVSPTLRVNPGDLLVIHFRNDVAPPSAASSSATPQPAAHVHDVSRGDDCAGGEMSDSSTNLHFHGMHVQPTCHQDEVLRTVIPVGNNFEYRIRIPKNHPPGIYWYHPHLHGSSQRQLQGGASGALIVEGAQAIDRQLAGLPERILVIRDQPGNTVPGPSAPAAPSFDISLNYAPIDYPAYVPPSLLVKPNERQFWRVINASANTILNLQLLFDGTPQLMRVFSVDGIPIPGGPVSQRDVPLGPGARAEMIVPTPKAGQSAQLITRKWDTGPMGDSDPERPLAKIISDPAVKESLLPLLSARALVAPDLSRAKPVVDRHLYFAESANEEKEGGTPGSEANEDANTRFYLIVGGQPAALFNMKAPPNLVVHQDTVEDWTISNTSFEDHVFHIHQLHFKVLEIDGRPVNDPAIRDTINIPHLRPGVPPPSVKLRMDFRGTNLVGTFIYQCHIVAHEEGGMMGTIQVLPPGLASSIELHSPSTTPTRQPVTVTARVRSSGKAGTPLSGAVQFAVDGNMDGSPVPIKEGKAERVFTFYKTGTHTITAAYSGDPAHQAAQAAGQTVVSQ